MKERGLNIMVSNNSSGGGFSQAPFDVLDSRRPRGILFIASAGKAEGQR
jgi:hypothetical protein